MSLFRYSANDRILWKKASKVNEKSGMKIGKGIQNISLQDLFIDNVH
jgi:hypothetical protein